MISELFLHLIGVSFELCIPLGMTSELFQHLLGVSFELYVGDLFSNAIN
jgi:hypothetical protein